MITLKDLTLGERLWLWQRRNNYNREDAAIKLGIKDARLISRWKRQKPPPTMRIELKHELTPSEMCVLYRMRSKRKLKELAKEFGVSHVTYIAREKDRYGDAAKDLLPWWEENFPHLSGPGQGEPYVETGTTADV